ncbi:hypothetical protein NE236_07940 [Actinoallomurus purpureus]|uniref:hypothetical protein n=1 Tax=Actinoallomurus purpureus TaxID=478114 RepID=UPI0020933F3C|nr:hypothetical protein [Actinoallomurus purpureus]MCO6004909.1 hypothetical protein [Actinoallomurus purpureus]
MNRLVESDASDASGVRVAAFDELGTEHGLIPHEVRDRNPRHPVHITAHLGQWILQVSDLSGCANTAGPQHRKADQMLERLLLMGAMLAFGDQIQEWKWRSDLEKQAEQVLQSPMSTEEQAELEQELSRSGSKDPQQNRPLGAFAFVIAEGIPAEPDPERQVQLASIATVAAERAAVSVLQETRVARAAKAVAAAKAAKDPKRMTKLALRSAKFLRKAMKRC